MHRTGPSELRSPELLLSKRVPERTRSDNAPGDGRKLGEEAWSRPQPSEALLLIKVCGAGSARPELKRLPCLWASTQARPPVKTTFLTSVLPRPQVRMLSFDFRK